MSALPIVELSPVTRPLDRVQPYPQPLIVERPTVVEKPLAPKRLRTKSKGRKKASALPRFAAKAGGFVVLASLTCFGSTLVGQVLVEKARLEGLKAETRTHDAERVEVALRDRVEALRNSQSVSDWAWDHEFTGPLGATTTAAPPVSAKAAGPSKAPVMGASRVALATGPSPYGLDKDSLGLDR